MMNTIAYSILWAALVAGCLGCGAIGRNGAGSVGSWKPELLYLNGKPHGALHVEVDAVEGCDPDEVSLRQLTQFLENYCDKPLGVRVVRSDIIPLEIAKGMKPEMLARRYLNGPPREPRSDSSAFMYVLFLNTALSFQSKSDTTAANAEHENVRSAPIFPHAVLYPYPAMIVADPAVNGPVKVPDLSRIFGPILRHEAGHLLGLARNPSHATNLHCASKRCLMFATYNPAHFLASEIWAKVLGDDTPLRARLCDACEAELKAARLGRPAAGMRFVGPVVVRSAQEYHVLCMPGRVKVVVGDLEDADCDNYRAELRQERAEVSDEVEACMIVKDSARRHPNKLRAAKKSMMRDPFLQVRQLAARL